MSEWTQVKKKSRIGSKKSGPVEITGSAMIADDGGGQSPPPPPDRNTAQVSLPSKEFSAARVADEVSYVLPTSPSIGRLTFGQAQSVGSIEPSTFLRPSHSANYTFPHVESPLAVISGSALDTDFTPLTPSIDRRATIEEVIDEDDVAHNALLGSSSPPMAPSMEKKHDREDGTSEPVALLKKLHDEAARQRRELAASNERKLCDKRVEDDAEYATEIMARDLVETEDRRYAEVLEAIELKLRGSNSEVERNAAEALAQIRRTDGVEALTGQATGSDMVNQGYSNIPDQGIEWRDKVPYEVSPARTRGSSLASQQRYEQKRSEKRKPANQGLSESQRGECAPEMYTIPDGKIEKSRSRCATAGGRQFRQFVGVVLG
ncbi:hypothetical protein C8J57DRAFT_1256180 [Mycena rebaudengoi]|nr:hypothetical protein C8J57DRAFT_1256180 [Mycena rebaudengoi]